MPAWLCVTRCPFQDPRERSMAVPFGKVEVREAGNPWVGLMKEVTRLKDIGMGVSASTHFVVSFASSCRCMQRMEEHL